MMYAYCVEQARGHFRWTSVAIKFSQKAMKSSSKFLAVPLSSPLNKENGSIY